MCISGEDLALYVWNASCADRRAGALRAGSDTAGSADRRDRDPAASRDAPEKYRQADPHPKKQEPYQKDFDLYY